MEVNDYEEYRLVFSEFQDALRDRLDHNLKAILRAANIEKTDFEKDLERQYPRETTDYAQIESVGEWQTETLVPDCLTEDLAK